MIFKFNKYCATFSLCVCSLCVCVYSLYLEHWRRSHTIARNPYEWKGAVLDLLLRLNSNKRLIYNGCIHWTQWHILSFLLFSSVRCHSVSKCTQAFWSHCLWKSTCHLWSVTVLTHIFNKLLILLNFFWTSSKQAALKSH